MDLGTRSGGLVDPACRDVLDPSGDWQQSLRRTIVEGETHLRLDFLGAVPVPKLVAGRSAENRLREIVVALQRLLSGFARIELGYSNALMFSLERSEDEGSLLLLGTRRVLFGPHGLPLARKHRCVLVEIFVYLRECNEL